MNTEKVSLCIRYLKEVTISEKPYSEFRQKHGHKKYNTFQPLPFSNVFLINE